MQARTAYCAYDKEGLQKAEIGMIIRNGTVFEENGTFSVRDIYVKDGLIVSGREALTDDTVVDASGLYVLPGLIDVHSHGAVGHDFSDGDEAGLTAILKYERAHGITSYCPTTMALPRKQILRALDTARHLTAEDLCGNADGQKTSSDSAAKDGPASGARLAGIHLEGPFLSGARRGAHDASCLLEPDLSFFRECSERSGGLIKLVTIAPELPGALSFIQALRGETHISLGHTDASYEICKKALRAGADHITHLYNAMAPLHHRDPGPIGAAMDAPDCMAELICDGIHVHETMVRAAFRLFPDRIVLISDSMRATGLEDGTYTLGGQEVSVKGRRATLADGTLAGSATNLYDCMRLAVSFGIPLWEAVAAATIHPARSIGIQEYAGSLAAGRRADILLADRELNLIQVL